MEDVFALLWLAASRGWPAFFLGRGSNVLIADAGLPGVTLHLAKSFQKVERQADSVRVGAGVRLNAGAHGGNLGQRLKRVWAVTPELELKELTVAEVAPGYRTSRLLHLPHWLVVEAEFVLTEETSPAVIQERRRELLEARRARQPAHPRTCGSVFKNPLEGPPAGRLIEEAGLKGRSLGAAQVSRKHANFIINRGGATAAQMEHLMADIEASVWEKFGIRLEREVVCLPQDMP